MTPREVSRAFARRTNDVCEEMGASITRGLLLFDRVSQDYIDAHWMGKSLRRYSDDDVAEAMHVVEFLYNGAFTWCRLWFVHKSLWSSDVVRDARDRSTTRESIAGDVRGRADVRVRRGRERDVERARRDG